MPAIGWRSAASLAYRRAWCDLAAEVASSKPPCTSGYGRRRLPRRVCWPSTGCVRPFNGVVKLHQADRAGEWVSAQARPCWSWWESMELRLDFPVAEDYLADIRPDTVVASAQRLPGHTYRGRGGRRSDCQSPIPACVLSCGCAPQQGDQRLVPGMSVSAWLKLDTGRRRPGGAQDAILRYPDGRVIGVDDENRRRPCGQSVGTRVTFDALVEIRDGLARRDARDVAGNEALLDGQRVIIDAPPPGGAGDV